MEALFAALAPVIALIVKALVELFMEKSNEPSFAEDADSNSALRERLLKRLHEEQNRAGTSRDSSAIG